MSRSSNLKVVRNDEPEVGEAREPDFKDGDGDFETGSLVQLMSGGPAMTVLAYDPKAMTVAVAWFNEDELNGAEFPEEALTLWEDEEE